MQASILTQLLLPAVLALIMFGMGLSLTRDDFTRLLKMPRAIALGLVGQILLLPGLALATAMAFGLSPELAIGLMILSACPGGTMSNVISHLSRANLALSVSLTAIATVVCVFTTPMIIQASVEWFAPGEGQSFSLLKTSIGLIFITLLPVLAGIWCRQRWVNGAMRWETFFRRFSLLFMLVMIVAIMIQERATLISSFDQVFWATLTLNLAAITVGVVLGKLFKLPFTEQLTLGIEVGIQNASMAILIAVTFIGSPAFATAAGVYGLTMYIGAGLLVLFAKRQRKRTLLASQAQA